MANFVVITKTHGEEPEADTAHIPANWPKDTAECDTLEEAVSKYPGREVMTGDAYAHFSRGKDLAQKLLVPIPVPKKSWWKFWG